MFTARDIKLKVAVLFLLMFICSLNSAYGDNIKDKGRIGISATLQGGQMDYLFPVWFKDGFVLIPAIRVIHVSDAVTDLGFGIAFRFTARDNVVVQYYGARFGTFILNPKGDSNSLTDYICGPFVGGEYFISDHFSFAVEAQLNIAISAENSSRFGNPDGINVNTASAVFATLYF